MDNSLILGKYVYPIKKNSTLEEIVSLLSRQNSIPKYSIQDKGSVGTYFPAQNEVFINPNAPSYLLDNTVLHETHHALENTMMQEASKNPNTQFAQGLEKLFAPTKLPLAFPWSTKSYQTYRNSPDELRAFGVANYGSNDVNAPHRPHIDTTMAQEAAVLRDLFKRNIKK